MRKSNIQKCAVFGFTLVEMAIVLVIIGIILAGVMKGRDIVRGSQVKAFSQQFAQKWGTIAQTYYDKTGQLLNDGAVNGGREGYAPDGKMDGWIAAVGRDPSVLDVLENVGISPCSLIKSKLKELASGSGSLIQSGSPMCTGSDDTTNVLNPWQTLVEGEYAGTRVVTVDLVSLDLTMNDKVMTRNCVMLYNVPVDVAKGLDTVIDGKADGQNGSCICIATYPISEAETITKYTRQGTYTATAGAWNDDVMWGDEPAVETCAIILDF